MKRILSKGVALVLVFSFLLTGCGSTKVDAGTTVATLGDTEITYGFANFYAQLMQVYYDSYYVYFYGEDFWSTDTSSSGDGSATMESDVREELLDEIEQLYRIKEHAADYGVTLSDEDNEAIAEAVENFMDQNTDAAIEKLGATEDIVTEYLELITLQERVMDIIYDEADVSFEPEEYECRTFSYVSIDLSGYYDDDSNYVEYTEDEIAQLEQDAEDLVASADASGDFTSVAEDAGYTVETCSYTASGDADLADAVIEVADTLQEGEISDPITVEDENTIYVICLDSEYDEEASQDKLEELTEDAQEEYFDSVYASWQEESTFSVVESVWKKVSFASLYEADYDSDTDSESGDASGDASADASSDVE